MNYRRIEYVVNQICRGLTLFVDLIITFLPSFSSILLIDCDSMCVMEASFKFNYCEYPLWRACSRVAELKGLKDKNSGDVACARSRW